MRSAADQLKRVTLELGGKSPNIFFADADFEAAVDGALFGAFINQGEVCSAGSRVLVQRTIYKKFVDACAAKAKTIKLGPGHRPAIPRWARWSARSSATGSRSTRRSARRRRRSPRAAARRKFGKGWYVEPTIFYDVDNSARDRPGRDLRPGDERDPVQGRSRRAARSPTPRPYGLAAAVWTRDIFKAFRVVKQLEAGIVWVNHMQPTMLEAPWGGYKMSGFGRELGHWGVEEYLETKQVYINLDETPIGWY